jgi:mono/diheme cytochrome c family protein
MMGANAAGIALALASAVAAAQSPESQFTPAQIRQGFQIFSQNCAPCHGARMRDGQAAFDLRTFPPNQKGRFVISLTKGKNQMPPFGDLFKSEEVEALWAYVVAGEKQ